MKKTRILMIVVLCVLFAGAGCGKPITLQQKVTLPFIPVMSGQQFPLPPNAPTGYAFANESIPYVVNASMLPSQDSLNTMVAQQIESVLGDFVQAEILSMELVSVKLTATANDFSFLTAISADWTPSASGSLPESIGTGVFNAADTEILLTPASPLNYDDAADGGTLTLLVSGNVPENSPTVSVSAQVAVTVKVTISL